MVGPRVGPGPGYAYAQTDLAFALLFGQGVAKDETRALVLFQLAAAQGQCNAKSNIGYMYGNGLGGLAKSKAEALKWYARETER